MHSVKNQRSERKNSSDRKSSFQTENVTRNISQIDAQTNSFLTKPFLVKQVDQYLSIDQIIVFKGSFEVSANQILNAISPQNHHKKLLNKIYINCQLLLINSYSTQSIGEWYGYSLSDEGCFALPMGFFSYNSSSVEASITFLWTAIELSNQKILKQMPANKAKQIDDFVTDKLKKLRETIINIPVQFQQKGSKLSQINKPSDLSPFQSLIDSINLFNQKIYPLWKKYQQYQQKSIQTPKSIQNEQKFEKIFTQKLKYYERALMQYQWKNDIIVTEEIQPQQNLKQPSQCEMQDQEEMKQTLFKEEKLNKKMPAQLARLKKDTKVDDNLPFYPFSQHSRLIKLANQDFRKIAQISSMSCKSNSNLPKDISQRPHLIIFVHGYQASSFDMQTLANFFKFKQPQKIKVFLSSCNQGRTQQPIEESGHRLAVEIKNFINNKFDYEDFEISFACHSMGGLIARAALKYLQLYKSKFKTFLSLCSPHLGYLYHSSALIKTSLWVLNQVKKDASMIELTMQDHNQLQKTFLYELSKRTELSWFKYPIFIGSRQDQYVPFWSALVRDKDFFFQTKQAKIYKMLYKNLGQSIQHKTIRLQAIYKDRINDLSSFVGRTAHIRILNCIEVMQMIYLLIEKAF